LHLLDAGLDVEQGCLNVTALLHEKQQQIMLCLACGRSDAACSQIESNVCVDMLHSSDRQDGRPWYFW